MFGFIMRHQGNVERWETHYAFSIAQTINRAAPGDVIAINVGKAVEIGSKQKMNDVNAMFLLDQGKQVVGVQLKNGATYWSPYVMERTLRGWRVDQSEQETTLRFEVGV